MTTKPDDFLPLPESTDAQDVRGGLLTQASVLKVTANGTTTSPVQRGAWIMERILGKPPPPPPPSVPAIEPDTPVRRRSASNSTRIAAAELRRLPREDRSRRSSRWRTST